MPAIPAKRLFVYTAAGLMVLVVGILGLVSMRDGGKAAEDGLVIDASEALGALAGGAVDSTAPGIEAPGEPSTTTLQPSITTTLLIYVQVAGAVRRPGVYRLPSDARAFQAVLEAGGFAEEADQEAVALAATLTDGCRLYVPRMGEATAPSVASPGPSSAGISGGSAPGAVPGGSSAAVSLNSATAAELESLPGIGSALAERIVAHRETQGPFTSIDQLAEVPGIGPAKLEELRPLVVL